MLMDPHSLTACVLNHTSAALLDKFDFWKTIYPSRLCFNHDRWNASWMFLDI